MELVNRFGCDPVVLFSPAEMRAELQRWDVLVPTRGPDEPEPLYVRRLRLVSGARSPKTAGTPPRRMVESSRPSLQLLSL